MNKELELLRDRMYEDMVELGLIDNRIPREEYTPMQLWEIIDSHLRGKEIF